MFEVFCRSLLLLYLLATLHLFARAAPLKRDCHRANGGIKGCRGFVRGAPIALALCVAFHCLPQAQAMHMPPLEDVTGLTETADLPMATEQEHAGLAPEVAAMPPDTPALCEGLQNLGFRVPSVVVRYQRSHIANLQWWDRGIDAKLWCAMVKSVCGSHEPCYLELFQGRVSHSDIRLSTGHLWPPGGEIFVGFNLTPLPERMPCSRPPERRACI